ncbi:hypothetical protein AB0C02_26085 [Micromonospora sp. NPDC048999]|uniref:hypothetical protein n=1 Tax=Micromonospora sp. NPDC048999 TaxID=3155391 RepID=UPI0033FFB640
MTTIVGQRDAVVDGVDVDAVAAAARACPDVVGLTAGWMGGRTAYLPGRRVEGVAVDADAVVVQVRSRWGVTAGELAGQVRAAVAPLAAGRRVDVAIADLEDPPRAGKRRLRAGRVLPHDRRLAGRHQPLHRPGPGRAEDGDLAPREPGR